jgi:hypothetical protein
MRLCPDDRALSNFVPEQRHWDGQLRPSGKFQCRPQLLHYARDQKSVAAQSAAGELTACLLL